VAILHNSHHAVFLPPVFARCRPPNVARKEPCASGVRERPFPHAPARRLIFHQRSGHRNWPLRALTPSEAVCLLTEQHTHGRTDCTKDGKAHRGLDRLGQYPQLSVLGRRKDHSGRTVQRRRTACNPLVSAEKRMTTPLTSAYRLWASRPFDDACVPHPPRLTPV
jgi:hypothetical protein